MSIRSMVVLWCSLIIVAWVQSAESWATEVNVYSARQEELIKPVLDRFSEQTGIRVNLITGNADELITRIASEGRNSPADLLITTDVGRLYRAKQQQLLQPLQSDFLNAQIPTHLRDEAGYWFGLTVRARPILYAVDRVDPTKLASLQDLTAAEWRGRICVRSSSHIYNQSLVASRLAHDGTEATEQWVRGVVANFARPPRGGDRDQIRALAAGVCDIAIANTYYLAGMMNDPRDQAAASQIKVLWPDQDSAGAHINISGAGLSAHAPNPQAGRQLLEFMLQAEAQQWYAEANHEYPVRTDVAYSETLQQFGSFKADTLPLERLGELNADALRLMDRARWR
ncbi:extracellular solute-binding protein [Alkalimonas collagenimarina]|uniref:Extracellular solute-binding protein n=1 Tax=Alkalimonas collagenimarina TaxID=400390 RepID=A0ABT9GWC3_9GAMM|nr:extracellular solute-binding protein [Alkalimonas collagenimarina]MDP4535164.1 extracellular solute-binding protein [Alkalimonas collagenimarina]